MSSQLNQDFKAQDASLFNRFFRDAEGRIVIAQPPNLPVLTGISAAILQIVLPPGKIQIMFSLIAYGALFTWAWLELFQGVNYFRRTLGLVSLIGIVALGVSLTHM
jgi:hypothetical protein